MHRRHDGHVERPHKRKLIDEGADTSNARAALSFYLHIAEASDPQLKKVEIAWTASRKGLSYSPMKFQSLKLRLAFVQPQSSTALPIQV